MYLVKSLRTFFGTNAERVATALNLFLPGDEFIETDTSDKYIHNGMAWVTNSAISDVGDLTTATGSSGEMVRVAAAGGLEYRTTAQVLSDIGAAASSHTHSAAGSDGQLLYNNGGAFGGSDVYWDDVNSRLGVGTASPAYPLHISGTGNVAGFGNGAGEAQIIIDGAAGFVRDVLYRSGGVNRWIFRVNNTAESGSNAGSDFQIFARADDGSALGAGLEITRSTRAVSIPAGGLVSGSPTGGAKGTGTINAVAVYDDNVLLTDFVFEDDYQLLPIGQMKNFFTKNKHLPTIPGRKIWESEGKFSLGKLANHLWETIEVQAIYISQLNERLKVLENGK